MGPVIRFFVGRVGPSYIHKLLRIGFHRELTVQPVLCSMKGQYCRRRQFCTTFQQSVLWYSLGLGTHNPHLAYTLEQGKERTSRSREEPAGLEIRLLGRTVL